jgi:hypothetical protein
MDKNCKMDNATLIVGLLKIILKSLTSRFLKVRIKYYYKTYLIKIILTTNSWNNK